jgi:branched-chain amino acid transport system permease protein
MADQAPTRSDSGVSPSGAAAIGPTAPAARQPYGLRFFFAAGVLVLLALVPVIAGALGQPFYVTLFTRILIFGLAAMGLNLILGYGALVSFGHAMYMGLGAYAVGILGFYGITNGWVQLAAALLVGIAVAVAVGAICLRTSGMAFIMITLAFAQMLYFLAVSLREYGGDDGMQLKGRSLFGGLDLNNSTVLYYLAYALLLAVLFDLANANTLYYVTFALVVATLFVLQRLVHSRFGMVLRGCKSNERRMGAMGFPTLRYKLAAYVISACVCVVAGMLLANLTRFVAPSYMAWTVSGELIVMIVLGGMGTLLGPLVGAAALLMLEELLSSAKLGIGWFDTMLNQHWMAVIGIFIVLVVIVLKQGIYGRLVAREEAME